MKQEQLDRSAHSLALVSVLMWSTVATAFKLGLVKLSIEQLLLVATIFSWLVFLVYCTWRRCWFLHARDRWAVIGLGAINPFAYYLLLFAAYERLPAHIAQPLNYTWAITLAILAVPFLKQKLSWLSALGIGVSYAGVVILLTTSSRPDSDGWNTLGVVLALASTLLWAAYWIINTRSQSNPAALMFWSFTAAIPMIATVCLVNSEWPALDKHTITYGLWVGCIEMGITFLMWQQALKWSSSTARISQLIFLSPFISMLIIYFVLHEAISLGAVAGLVVIVAGLLITQRYAKR